MKKTTQKNRKQKKGFTIIELLVVVAIIALLASVVLVSLGTVRTKAKDAKVSSEFHSIQLALESYNANHGGYPNPNYENPSAPSDNLYCIGATDCIMAGYEVTTKFPDIDDTVAKLNSNLAAVSAIFPNYTQNISYNDSDGNENRGYIYINCTDDDRPTCDSNTAIVAYPTQTSVVFVEVGSFTEVGCELSVCEANYGHDCGNGSEDCSNYYSGEIDACNYDAKGTGSRDYSCVNYGCTNSSACNYDSSATEDNGSCEYTSCLTYSCQGTVQCGYSTEYECGYYTYCDWSSVDNYACTGTYSYEHNCSEYTYYDCPSNGSCYPTDDGMGSQYCSGGSFYDYADCGSFDEANCGYYPGCTLNNNPIETCGANTSCADLDETTCSGTNGCSWNIN